MRNTLDALRQQRVTEDSAQNSGQVVAANASHIRNEVEKLQQKLENVRIQPAEDSAKMPEPANVENNDALSRELELQAALQAERQQAAIMRKTLEERERALNELEAQCESLENNLEDQEREMDHLHRKIEQVANIPVAKSSHQETAKAKTSTQIQFASGHALGISELFRTESFERYPRPKIPWQLIGGISAAVIVLGMIVVFGVLLWPHFPRISSIFGSSQPTYGTIATPTQPSPIPAQNIQTQPQITPAPVEKNDTTLAATATPAYVIPHPIRDSLSSGGQGPQMLKLPAGVFFMGNKVAFTAAEQESQPFHQVTIQAFYIARYETSFDEYDRFARATGRPLSDDAGFGRGNHPVINVAWGDAQAYVQWLSSETGHHYYLPSEAQWEYAARGGTNMYYWWGDMNQQGQAVCFSCGTPWDMVSTAPVGSLKPNPFGLYDTAGNVMEWVQDCYNEDYTGAPNDGSPWMTGDCTQHMVRGGAFNKPMSAAHSAARFKLPTEGTFNMLGFRVARD